MKKLLLACAAAIALAAPGVAQASDCPFTVTKVLTYSEGYLGVELANSSTSGGWTLCNINNSGTVNFGSRSGTVTADACKALLATLVTAMTTNRPAIFNFESATTCTVGGSGGPPAFWGAASPFPAVISLG